MLFVNSCTITPMLMLAMVFTMSAELDATNTQSQNVWNVDNLVDLEVTGQRLRATLIVAQQQDAHVLDEGAVGLHLG